MKKKENTAQTKREIAALYADKTNKTHDIAAAYGITTNTLTRIVLEMGGELRRPKSSKKRAKICPHCRRAIEVKDARYCYFCGADIRSEAQLLIDRLKRVHELIPVIPANSRDELRDIINDAIGYLRRAKND